jgi:phenylpropionate dioxygenase-like ring-hydroxylating dioxygenase large terminal subunit
MTLDVDQLVSRERGIVSRRIFWDEALYRLELERIFTRCWLFLAHESQVAQPGEYFTTWMGDEPIIVARDRDHQVRAMINSCRHRGNSVCRADAGQARSFLCAYHGWTYGLDGSLIGVPGDEDRYYGDLDRTQWGLIRVPQVASYKGLIFGCFDPNAPSLEEYLGQTRWALDYILDQRAGGTETVGGVYKWLIKSNWKLGADNIMGDNYHGAVTHRSATLVGHHTIARHERGSAESARAPSDGKLPPRPGFTAPLAWGHGFMTDLLPPGDDDFSQHPEPLRSYYRDTLPELAQRLGPLRARVKKINLTVFPNLSFTTSSNMLRVWHPRGPHQTEVWLWSLVDKDAPPEVKRVLRRAGQRHFSPAGLFEQDDMDNWELSTRAAGGTISRHYPLHYAMGVGHEEWAADGVVTRQINAIKDESNQRAFYGGWADFMSGADWDELRRRREAWEGVKQPQPGGARG